MTRRKKPAAAALPAPLVEWFRGERTRPPMAHALAFPGWPLLPERWRAWVADNPGAVPPAGYEWLANPTHPRHSVFPPALANARRVARSAATWPT